MTVALRVCSVLAAPTTNRQQSIGPGTYVSTLQHCKTGTCIQGIPRGYGARLFPQVNGQSSNRQGSDGSVSGGSTWASTLILPNGARRLFSWRLSRLPCLHQHQVRQCGKSSVPTAH